MQKAAFSATIKERYCLNPGSDKETYHLVLNLKGSDIQYNAGDCLGIYPENDPSLVQQIMQQWNASGDEEIEDRQGTVYSLKVFLSQRANLVRTPQEPQANLQAFCKGFPPLLPRFYSIASSMQAVGHEAHLIVGLIDGLCTHFLCKRLPLDEPNLTVFHHPARQFSLPSPDKPIIMIGPGTGVAPFRGFMQERLAQQSSAPNWLFFGERSSKTDFYYQPFWENLALTGKLTLDCAFSRDQSHKIYVQHRMLEKSRQLWQWLQDGACLYVCGNASHMAKDVDKTLLAIAENEGGLTHEEAKAYFKDLKKTHRYQRDVY